MEKFFKSVRSVLSGICVVVMVICLMGNTVQAQTYEWVTDVDFCDLASWRSGCYNWTDGKYTEYSYRICLDDIKRIKVGEYEIAISNKAFKLTVRELDSNKKMIGSVTLKDGDCYSPKDNTEYVAITLYKYEWETDLSWSAFEKMFEKGFELTFTSKEADVQTSEEVTEQLATEEIVTEEVTELPITGEVITEEVTELPITEEVITEEVTELPITEEVITEEVTELPITEAITTEEITNSTITAGKPMDFVNQDTESVEDSSLEACDFSDLNNWMTGCYNWTDGKYMENSARICLKEYKTFSGDGYIARITSSAYKLLVREMDADMQFICSKTLADGMEYVPGDKAVYLGISLYCADGEYGVTYSKYEQLFADGFVAELQTPTEVEVEEDVQFATLEEEIRYMLENEGVQRDISRFNASYSEMYKVYNKLIQGEYYLMSVAYVDAYLTTTRTLTGKIATIEMSNVDSGVNSRCEKLKKSVAKALEEVQSEMNDLEKIIVLHDYLVYHTTYTTDTYAPSSAVGPLVYGMGICGGYAHAMNVLLHEVGITSYYLSSASLCHAWNMVELDGELYHLDATWDDGSLAKTGKKGYAFFLKNDDQFINSGENRSHYGWKSYAFDATSTSERFRNWFVHDVSGKMLYKDGYWYYAEGEKLNCSKIDGSDKSTVISEVADIELISIEGETITYSVNGEKKVYEMK